MSDTAAISSSFFPPGIANEVSVVHKQFPRISGKIIKMWGSAELHSYLTSIIFDERGGRHGFPEQIITALFRIHQGHEALVQTKKSGDIWDVILEHVG
jgi:hypothetical protein